MRVAYELDEEDVFLDGWTSMKATIKKGTRLRMISGTFCLAKGAPYDLNGDILIDVEPTHENAFRHIVDISTVACVEDEPWSPRTIRDSSTYSIVRGKSDESAR